MEKLLRCLDCPYYSEYVPGVGFCNKDAQFVEAIQEKCGEEEIDGDIDNIIL